MNNRLRYIHNWKELAAKADWSASMLANGCGVSLRTLQRYFGKEMGKSPKVWLAEQRQYQAMELLRKGHSVKELADRLGYEHPTHFSRDFKRYWGCTPTD